MNKLNTDNFLIYSGPMDNHFLINNFPFYATFKRKGLNHLFFFIPILPSHSTHYRARKSRVYLA